MTISILIPAYNSEKKIEALIRQVKKVTIPEVQKEIIVVDDCSKDKTYSILKKIKGIKIFRHKRNTGKGGALRTAFQHATGNIYIIQDDDLEYDPMQIPQLIKPIIEGKAQIVYGSRRLNKTNKYSSNFYYFGGSLVDMIISFMLGVKLTDAITGSKAFSKDVYQKIKPIESNGFDIEAEITAKSVKAGYMPFEIPISYNPRSIKEGKNIRWHHAIPIIKTLIKFTFRQKKSVISTGNEERSPSRS